MSETKNYVTFANDLDSAGQDSSDAAIRLQSREVLYRLFVSLKMLVLLGNELDNLKKHIYYGKELELGDLYEFMGMSLKIPNSHPSAEVVNRVQEHESIRFLHALIGVIGEVGEELGSLYIDYTLDGKEIDQVNVREEVGDSLWYHALFAKYLGYENFDTILQVNMDKLTSRYKGTRWNQDGALNRDLEKEREILEQDDLFAETYGMDDVDEDDLNETATPVG